MIDEEFFLDTSDSSHESFDILYQDIVTSY